MKRVIVLALIFSLFFSTAFIPKSFAETTVDNQADFLNEAFEESTNLEDSNTQTIDIKNDDGNIIGKEIITISRKVEKNIEEGIVTITLNRETHTELDGKVSNKVYDTEVVSYTTDGEVIINGIVADQNELNELVYDSKSPVISSRLASGGLSYLTSYKETSSKKYTLKAFKEPTNAFLDGGKGTPRTKKNVSYGAKVVDFKQLSKNVSSARSTILEASAAMITAGIGALYWWTVVGLIGSATGAGIAATKIYSASNSAKADMKEAYNLLK
ncbi:hypothetical protein [Peribacillus muralis]|uniref:hypothetical protein n=1 Tax=Peribacillus muralis TaxID=264697 RepID=UPI003CFD3664